VFETPQPQSSNAELHLKIHGQIIEDINLEVIRQLEELVARFHAYEAICIHLNRERMPLPTLPANHAGL